MKPLYIDDARYMWIWHADQAEQRLAREGIKPELLAYLVGIGESVR